MSFIDIKVSNRVLLQCKTTLNVGDQVEFEGKLVVDKWNDSQSGQSRQAMKVQAEKLIAHITKQEIECLKAAGLIGGNQQS